MKYLRNGFAVLPTILIVAAILAVLGGVYTWQRQGWLSGTPSLAVTSPQSGDVWAVGETYMITWTAKNIPADHKISVSIRRVSPPPLQEEGQEFDPIIFVDLENTGTVDWTIADMYPSGTYVLGLTSYESIPVTNPITVESQPFKITHDKLIGGDKDAHGCLIAAGYSWCEAKNKCIRSWEEYCTNVTSTTVTFQCDEKKSIVATFYPEDDAYVDLVLSDERMMSVAHATSASGARYASPDEDFVFWNKGETAFITENETTTFANCVIKAE